MMKETVSLAGASEALDDEHRHLDELVRRLRSAPDLAALVVALEKLNAALVVYFAHEESPGGLYDVLGVCAAEYRTPLGDLVDEHYRILSEARGLAARGRELLERLHLDLHQEARGLADRLGEHAEKERRMTESALEHGSFTRPRELPSE